MVEEQPIPAEIITNQPEQTSSNISTNEIAIQPQEIVDVAAIELEQRRVENRQRVKEWRNRPEVREQFREYQRLRAHHRYQEDPEYRERVKARQRKYDQQRKGKLQQAISPQDGSLTIKDATNYLGISESTIRRWIKDGKLSAYQRPIPQGYEWRIQIPGESGQQTTDNRIE